MKNPFDTLQTRRLSSCRRFVILPAVALFFLIGGLSSAKEPAAAGPCGDATRRELARAIAKGDADWAAAILEQNRTVCGGYEYYFRARVITALMSGDDLPKAGSDEILRHVLDYVGRMAYKSASADPLDSSIRDRARRLGPQFAGGSERHLYAILYAGDDLEEFSALLWSVPRPDCPLRQALWQHQDALRRSIRRGQARARRARRRDARHAKYPEAGVALRFGPGYWKPTGQLSRFGSHLMADDVVGYQWGRTEVDLATSISVLPSRNTYQVEINSTTLQRRDFLRMYVGGEIGIKVFTYNRLTIMLAGGAGLDVLGGLNEKKYGSIYNFSGLSVRAGMMTTYLLKSPYFLFQDLRYNRYWYFGGFVDRERHGQDLGGGAFSYVLGIGLKVQPPS